MAIASNTFQADYRKAVRNGKAPEGYGLVTDYYGRLDPYGSVEVIIEFTGGRLSPYFNQAPEPDEIAEVENDPREWADTMSGATDWSEWDWVEAATY